MPYSEVAKPTQNRKESAERLCRLSSNKQLMSMHMTPHEITYSVIDIWGNWVHGNMDEESFFERLLILAEDCDSEISFVIFLAIHLGRWDMAQKVIQKCPDWISPEPGEPDLFHNAICSMSDRRDIIRFLCDNGISPTHKWINGWFPLHHAVMMNKPNMVAELIKCGANINERAYDVGGHTALMEAATFGKDDCAIVLLDSGADAKMKSTDTGETAKQLAKRNGYNELSEIL